MVELVKTIEIGDSAYQVWLESEGYSEKVDFFYVYDEEGECLNLRPFREIPTEKDIEIISIKNR